MRCLGNLCAKPLHSIGNAADHELPIALRGWTQIRARLPHHAAAQVLEELPDKIRKRIPIEVDAAHR